jgi:D-serine deaminase-like pyridoxal phosphate-dependent protein
MRMLYSRTVKRNSKKAAIGGQDLGPNSPLIGTPRSRQRLATPALILDLAPFEHNLAALIGLCKKAKLSLRPHAKTHKCAQIAKLQIESGAIGVSTANLHEAAVMVEAGIPGVLLTSPIVGPTKINAFVDLVGKAPGLMAVIDSPESAKALEAQLERSSKRLPILVDVDIGMKRTGVPDVAGVLQLVRRAQASKVLHFAGIQAYSGMVQHITRAVDRARVYGAQLQHLQAVLQALAKNGHHPGIVSGGGTGTFDIDRRAGLFTEVQCGSYAVMDVEYQAVQLFKTGAHPFKTALYVQCMVVSNNYLGSATIDGGFKCFSMDGPLPQTAAGAPKGAKYQFYGDEFGKIHLRRKRDSLALGCKIELVAPHCDPTINLHSFIHCVRKDVLVDIWPVGARGPL